MCNTITLNYPVFNGIRVYEAAVVEIENGISTNMTVAEGRQQ